MSDVMNRIRSVFVSDKFWFSSATRLKRNIVANASGGVMMMLGQLAAFSLGLYATGDIVYAQWLAIFSIAVFGSTFDFGIAAATVRGIARRQSVRSNALNTFLSASLLLTVVDALLISAASLLISFWLSNNSSFIFVTDYFWMPAATVAIALFGRHFQSINQGNHRYDIERLHQVLSMIIRLLILVGALFGDWGLIGVAVADCLGMMLPGIFSSLRIKKTFPQYRFLVLKNPAHRMKEILKFGLPWFSVGMSVQATSALPPVLLGLFGVPYLVLAVSAALKLSQALKTLMGWVLEPLMPALAAVNKAEANNLVFKTSTSLSYFGLLIIAPSTALMLPFTQIWLRDSGIAFSTAMIYLAFAFALYISIPRLGASVLVISEGRPGFFIWESLAFCFLFLACVTFAGRIDQPVYLALLVILPSLIVEPIYIFRSRLVLNNDFLIRALLLFFKLTAEAVVVSSLLILICLSFIGLLLNGSPILQLICGIFVWGTYVLIRIRFLLKSRGQNASN